MFRPRQSEVSRVRSGQPPPSFEWRSPREYEWKDFMRLHQRGAFWVVLLFIAIAALFVGSQVWITFGAQPSTGVMLMVNMDSAPSGATTIECFLGERRTGRMVPRLDLPDSVTEFEEERFPVFRLDDDATRLPPFDLDAWLAENFPAAQVLEVGAPVAVSAEEEGAGVTGTVTEVRLRRADGSLDPFWFVSFSTAGSPVLWGQIARARVGAFVETSSWTAKARSMLYWRNHLTLRREINFGIEIWATYEENTPGETYWLDRVDLTEPTLPEGAVPTPLNSTPHQATDATQSKSGAPR